MEAIRHISKDVRERLVRILAECALDQRLAIGTDLPDLQVCGAVLRVLGRRDKFQAAVVVKIRDGVVPGILAVVLLECTELAVKEVQLIVDIRWLRCDGFQLIREGIRSGADSRRQYHGQYQQIHKGFFHCCHFSFSFFSYLRRQTAVPPLPRFGDGLARRSVHC